jgi:polyisoprenoid-binding protein YceI
MFKRFALVALVLVGLAASAGAATWNIDVAHSRVGFAVRHLVVSRTNGEFTDFAGAIEFDGKDLAAGSVSMTVQTASVDTENTDRDDHLRNPDFFDAEKFPTMTFVSDKVTAADGSEFKLAGKLTIKDVTKEVVFDCEMLGTVDDPWGNTRAGFTAETKIDRTDFNLSFSKMLEGGGLVVGDEVTIVLDIETVKAK